MPARQSLITPALLAPLRYTSEEWAAILRGVVPEEMEDKWFIFCESGRVFFHRSWTGYCVYVADVERRGEYYVVTRLEVNRDPDQYGETDDVYDARLFAWLVRLLLLGEDTGYPERDAADDASVPLSQWSAVGRAGVNASDSGSHNQGTSAPVAAEPDLNGLGVVRAIPKHGDEPFHLDGKPMDFDLLAYWRWAASDLLNNTSRGNLAEFIVARALGVPAPLRATWEEYDLVTADGVRIEVKSSAYIQGWGQARHSKPRFGINLSRKWEKEHAGRAEQAARHSDVYVFALLHHMEQQTVDPTDLAQWTFYVLPTSTLDSKCPGQKTIGLGTLASLGARKAGYDDLRDAVAQAFSPSSSRSTAARGTLQPDP